MTCNVFGLINICMVLRNAIVVDYISVVVSSMFLKAGRISSLSRFRRSERRNCDSNLFGQGYFDRIVLSLG